MLSGAETDLAEMLTEAAEIYGGPDAAMKLRAMLMQYDTVNDKLYPVHFIIKYLSLFILKIE